MIIVTGASGQLGRAVVERLLAREPAEQIGVSVRNVEKAQELKERGVRVRRGDFEDPASLDYAFEGASKVLIVSSNTFGETTIRQHRTAIDSARRAGVSRIFYTSHMGSSPTSLFQAMVDHAATEAALRDTGVTFTSLRNGFYAASALMMLGNALETGELLAPEDGPVSWTAHADLAEAAALALSEEALDGVTPPLTASEALDLADIAAIAAELTQRPMRRVVVPDTEYRAGLVAHGFPEEGADMYMGIFRASRRGEFSRVDPTLARLIGRAPKSMRDILKEMTSPAR
ncbi:NAD-dependent epimerase/dehydratase family protein [Ktedonosporobacter rubrisoli]|uniref:NAD-dependent epimerase/dehydratase family protein n=1 Tax=Ktedonosporobacter rubrisoli TaxID=2509675 RepID=A0A4P6K059_KTERU|nr:NAD(P)H-binding protein [Ktedonosporobacter rubrisoli]QBD81000.1 NAD-dependent epimerase/dehydratase family protein [Ktedonosporobacter rubrisoli]